VNTSKKRGLAPFKGIKTDRLPMWYGGAPETTQNIIDALGAKDEDEALYDILGIDYMTFRPSYVGPAMKTFEDGSVDSIWGIRRGGYFYGQALNHPLADIETAKEAECYEWPDVKLWDCKISEADFEHAKNYCIIGGTWAPFFHDAIELLGMERFFIEMCEKSPIPEIIVEKCANVYYELTKKAFEQNPGMIDFQFIGNDFGSQRSLLMSPAQWRGLFKPQLKRFTELAHRNGAFAGVHSCGDIHEIIPDLIEIGFDAINPIQVSAEHMDPTQLKQEYGRDVVFFGGIDENEILRNNTPNEVREETRRMIEILGSDGRYIVAASHDFLLPEIPAINIIAMYEEAAKLRF
jgi:uroporphyrinogen decarboxylase